jgi:glycosyltransferase involved in cell wall biosynthesis
MSDKASYVVASPGHCHFDEDKARALAAKGLLRFVAKGTRRGTVGVPPELTRLNPKIGLVFTAAAMTISNFKAESLRFRLNPWFDHWVRKQLHPGDHIISSYGYANDSFRWVREHGGKTFLSAGSSHPENFWTIIEEEHKRWNCPDPPVARHHYERSMAMMREVDYVLSPSSFVTQSFLSRGFKPAQILKDVYTVNFSCFTPATTVRDNDRPLTIVSTGALSLRKGTPYLLEGFRLLLKRHPSARLRLTNNIQDSTKPILAKYSDLPIDWSPGLPHDLLAKRLQSSDIFVLPSLEEGLVRTALEAMACGLPVVLTQNTGSADYVKPGVTGEIVPIRDPQAIADAIVKCADRLFASEHPLKSSLDIETFSFESFEKNFIRQLQLQGLA